MIFTKLPAPSLLAALLLAATLPLNPIDQGKSQSFLNLDWQAPNLWVHVDNVDTKKVASFENARKGWLQVLHHDDEQLGDGRPLFWHAHSSPAGQTFFTFYPFHTWADLDARRQMINRTQEIVGEAAVKAYDAGDEALVSPHYSQLWHREKEFDIASSATQQLTELTATVGRIEVHTVDICRWDDFERAWKQVAETLAAHEYPLVCRAFKNMYGRGEYIILWLARDSAAYRAAAPLRTELVRQLGRKVSAKLLGTLKEVFPLTESYEVQRRPDLSNLGR